MKLRYARFFLGWFAALAIGGFLTPIAFMYLEELAGTFDAVRMAEAVAQSLGIAFLIYPVMHWLEGRKLKKQQPSGA
jgi:hypothetical protein